jgi:hypothetical protein
VHNLQPIPEDDDHLQPMVPIDQIPAANNHQWFNGGAQIRNQIVETYSNLPTCADIARAVMPFL